jgi:hypothetical protein
MTSTAIRIRSVVVCAALAISAGYTVALACPTNPLPPLPTSGGKLAALACPTNPLPPLPTSGGKLTAI